LGFSGRPRGAQRLGVQAAFAAGVLEQTVGAPAVIVGHSFGGAVALRLALDRPELVRALVLFAPVSRPWPGQTAWYNRLAARPLIGPVFAQAVRLVGPLRAGGALSNTFRPQPAPRTYGAELGAALLFRPHSFRANARDLAFLNAELEAQAPRYGQIRAPVRILFGDSDHVVTHTRHGLALAQAVRDGEAKILPGVGHMPHRAAPEAALAMIRAAVGE
jgi:pimeloyl-ACP methyl ester carboxylesterase